MSKVRAPVKRQGQKKSNKEKKSDASGTLKYIPFFSGLTYKALRDVHDSCRFKNYPVGETIIERGGKDKNVYFLLDGNAQVLNLAPSGKMVYFAGLEAGSFFGELSAIDGLPRSATVVAKTECSIAILTADKFIHLLTSFPDCLLNLVKKHAGIIRAGNDRISEFAFLDAEQRICLELLKMAEPDPAVPKRFVVYPLPTQEFIAVNVGVTRETVVRIFSKLTSEKIIRRRGKSLYIENPRKLEFLSLN